MILCLRQIDQHGPFASIIYALPIDCSSRTTPCLDAIDTLNHKSNHALSFCARLCMTPQIRYDISKQGRKVHTVKVMAGIDRKVFYRQLILLFAKLKRKEKRAPVGPFDCCYSWMWIRMWTHEYCSSCVGKRVDIFVLQDHKDTWPFPS